MRAKGNAAASLAAALLSIAVLAMAAKPELNHPTGTKGLLLIDKLGGHIRFFDPVTFQERSNFAVGTYPHDFALSADHKLAYVTIYGDGVYQRNPHPGHEIAIVDLVAHKLAGTIDIAPYRAPHGIQIDKKGLLYISCDLDRKVLVVDPKKRTIEAAIDNEGMGHWLAVLPDGSKAYVSTRMDKPYLSVLDLKTRKLVTRIPTPGTGGIAASPDGKTIVAVDTTEPVLLVIDPTTDTITDRISLKDQTRGSYKVYYTPDGSKVLTMNLGAKLMNIFDARNLKGEQTVLPTGKDPMGFAFSADGKTALVANHGDGTVSVVDLTSMRVTNNFHAGTGIETLTYY